MKQAQLDSWVLWLLVIIIAAVLVITIYYAWTGRLAGAVKPLGL